MGAIVIKEALARAGVKADAVDELIFGNVLQAGLGQNLVRQVAIRAGVRAEGLSYTVIKSAARARTVNLPPCASAMVRAWSPSCERL
jgi:acetyl-CoA acetyltransferase